METSENRGCEGRNVCCSRFIQKDRMNRGHTLEDLVVVKTPPQSPDLFLRHTRS